MDSSAGNGVPLWLKLAWTAWVALWAPIYWKQYGAQNFLYFCDIGNVLITFGLWFESRLILSWQAVGLLIFQILYTFDLSVAVMSGKHAIGGTEYMLDPAIPLLVRLLGLYHLIVPPLLLWSLRRLGFDRKAWKWQVAEAAVVVPVCYFWRPQFNVNWARGIGHEQHVMPGWLYLIAYLIVTCTLVYWPTHLLLLRWSKSGSRGVNRDQ